MAKEQTIKLGKDRLRLVARDDGKISIIIEHDRVGTESDSAAFITVTKPQLATLIDAINMFAAKHLE